MPTFPKPTNTVTVLFYEATDNGTTANDMMVEVRELGGTVSLRADTALITVLGKTTNVPIGFALVIDGTNQVLMPAQQARALYAPTHTPPPDAVPESAMSDTLARLEQRLNEAEQRLNEAEQRLNEAEQRATPKRKSAQAATDE